MTDQKNFGLLNLLVILVKWKRFLLLLFIITLGLSYLAIYLFIDERFEATALLLPSQEENSTASSLLSSLKGLPIDLAGINTNSDIDLYGSIINSRSVLDNVIKKFDLYKVYEVDTSDIDYYDKTLRTLRGNIDADANDDGLTYYITVTAPSPDLAAKMTNYIVEQLNYRIVDLKIKKSMMNREYLEERVNDIKDSLKNAEDQLKLFSENTGMFEAENQTKAILEQFAQFQASVAEKQTEYTILSQIYGKNSPQTINAKVVAEKLAFKLKEMEQGKDSVNTLLSLSKLPQNAMNYLRYFRGVEIYNNILEFVLPLYEQAKFQEQKNVPILQVIDSAIPPAKRSFPKRVILALLITIGIIIFSFPFIYMKENDELNRNDKYVFIRQNVFKWKK